MARLRDPRQPWEPSGKGFGGPLFVVMTEDPRRGQSRLPVWREAAWLGAGRAPGPEVARGLYLPH